MGTYAYEKTYENISFRKGEEIGLFNFGSTVVLVFEAPNFQWNIQAGDKVRMGQLIGCVLP